VKDEVFTGLVALSLLGWILTFFVLYPDGFLAGLIGLAFGIVLVSSAYERKRVP